jgi:metal-dependent amidase/aminoacylase/carboxypeptidase family protein
MKHHGLKSSMQTKIINSSRTYYCRIKHLNLNILEKKFRLLGRRFWNFTSILGAMFGLGSGMTSPALHNPDYDFPDEIIPTGINLFHQISKQILNAH